MAHIPVLQKEIIEYLAPKPNENFIDATLGEGGHTAAILERTSPRGKVLGIDFEIRVKPEERLILAEGNFADLKEIVEKNKFKNISGTLLDLGMSSWHLEESGRGFSFLKNEPLDMRYSPQGQLNASKIVNYWSYQDIERILRECGEEKFSKNIAEKIIEVRKIKPIKTTFHLVEIVNKAVPGWYRRGKINPATKTFQALRIAANDELNNLNKALPWALEILEKGGRMAVVSFHSLEDRIVKNFLREKAKENSIEILTKKPVVPSFEEIKINPKSRSAKLRAAIKV